MQRVGFAVIVVFAAGWLQLAAQTPQPFPGRPAPPRPTPGPPKTATPPPSTPAPPAEPTPAPPARAKPAAPTEAVLGVPVYPNAQFIATYDAGRGQQYHLFGSEMPFAALVKYYQSALKTRGTLVFDAPAVHLFEVGRFREETMAYPPGVTIKDYTWRGGPGFLNPVKGGTPAHFPSIIQIVAVPPGPR